MLSIGMYLKMERMIDIWFGTRRIILPSFYPPLLIFVSFVRGNQGASLGSWEIQ